MPRLKFGALLLVLAISVAGLASCGGDGTAPAIVTDPLAELGLTDGGTPGGGGGGGGGTATGACIITSYGTSYCINGVDLTTCQSEGGTPHSGTTCHALGYTNCSSYGGYQVCD